VTTALRREAEREAARLPPLLAQALSLAATVQAGGHGRRREGAGEAFWSYRPYRPGDEPRRIDWRRSARGDEVLVREREQAVAATVLVWPDRRPGMRWRSSERLPTKAERATVLALALASLLGRGGERCGLLGGGRTATGLQACERLAEALARPGRRGAGPASRGGTGVLLTDGLEPSVGGVPLAGGGVLMRIVDPAEADFPYAGGVIFADPAGVAERRLGGRRPWRLSMRQRGGRMARRASRGRSGRTAGHRTSDGPAGGDGAAGAVAGRGGGGLTGVWVLGPIGFAAPLALAALAGLPVAVWLLRAVPPPPRRVVFPPSRLLLGLRDPEETPQRTPWWLVALRLLAAALVVLAAARPLLSPQSAGAPLGTLVLAMDDGWAAAGGWARATAAAESALARAEAADADVVLAFTAPGPDGRVTALRTDAEGARARLRAHAPRPWDADRRAAGAALTEAARGAPGPVETLWATDGLDEGAGQAFAGRLDRPALIRASAPLGLTDARATAEGLRVTLAAAPGPARSGYVAVEDEAGLVLARAPFRVPAGAREGAALIAADWSALNRAAVARIEGADSAGAARVLSGAARRPVVGVVGDALARGRPLAGGGWYVARALQPEASVREGPLATVLAERPDALVLPGGPLTEADAAAVEAYVAAGGVLVRFADERLIAGPDPLVPAPLAERPRALDGALTWARPQGLGTAVSGPLAGLTPPADARVRRLAMFGAGAAGAQVWAALADGSPLVSAARRGRGWVVLMHVAATPGGSDLPLTGAFVEMLERLVRIGLPREAAAAAAGPWTPVRLLDGYGRWREPTAEDSPVASLNAPAGPGRAPGIYAAGEVRGALNVLAPGARLEPLRVTGASAAARTDEAAPRPFAGWLLLAALLLLALDALAARRLLGPQAGRPIRPPWLKARAGQAAAAGLLLLAVIPTPGRAQDATGLAAETRLAYVTTGEAPVDRVSRAGLEALTAVLRDRTGVAPGAPVGVDPARSELALYPALYWPITGAAQLSPAAAARVSAYLGSGGVILFDTRDDGATDAGARAGLRRVVGVLDPPALRVVGREHVLSRTFYLLESYPGRRPATRVWAAAPAGESVDGVSPVLIGGGDWAAAWASPGAGPAGVGRQQRELALRFGVNWVLYALTGTYKADQVHVPALLERLRRNGP
jgi:uncharacterized protein (DUF58 family)